MKAEFFAEGARKPFRVLAATVALGLAVALSAPVPGQARPDSFADLAEQVSDAVVNITTSTTIERPTGPGLAIPEGTPFEDFFREFGNPRGPQQRRGRALGSGFVISGDGFIVTNNHVIEKADEILVEFTDGRELVAEVVGADPKTDLALLKVAVDAPLPFVAWGDSDAARVGDWVMVVGNPLGQGFSVSAGIVSARERALQGIYDDYIQTDAAINRGNSGGPLFNMEGEVIGVNTAILSPDGGSIGIGFAMSATVASRVVDQLKEFGETRRGWLGVNIQEVQADVAEAVGLESAAGALVTDVPDGPALAAGIEVGDVIRSFDGADVVDVRDLVSRVGNTEIGKKVSVVVFRNGRNLTFQVEVGHREEAEVVLASLDGEPERPRDGEVLGLSMSPLTDELRAELGLDDDAGGLVVRDLDRNSEAFMKGIRPGDVVYEAGQEKVATLEDFEARIAEAGKAGRNSILLFIRRAGQPRFVALTLG